MRELPCAVAGLPRRCAPRNDNVVGMVFHPGISGASPKVVIARKVSQRTDVAIQSGADAGVALRGRWIATSLRSSQ